MKPMLAMFQLGFADCTAATTSFHDQGLLSLCPRCLLLSFFISSLVQMPGSKVSQFLQSAEIGTLLIFYISLSCVFGKISSHLEIFPGGCRMEVPTCSNKLGVGIASNPTIFSHHHSSHFLAFLHDTPLLTDGSAQHSRCGLCCRCS